MKESFEIFECGQEFHDIKDKLKLILQRSKDGNVFLNETKDSSVLMAVEIHTQAVIAKIKKSFGIEVRVEHWGFRNESGRRVAAAGHVHGESEALFSGICCIEGPGTWLQLESLDRVSTGSGQTAILIEPKAVALYPDKFKNACHHGSPADEEERLLFLASYCQA